MFDPATSLSAEDEVLQDVVKDSESHATKNQTEWTPALKNELSQYTEKNNGICSCLAKCECNSIKNHLDSIIGTASIFYDIITMVISVLDLITDVLVMIDYYNNGHDYFFTCSLIILIFAQLSYCLAFSIRHSNTYLPRYVYFLVFICCLPFSPIISFVFYFTTDQGFCSDLLDSCPLFNITYSSADSGQNESKFRVWFKQKLDKHIGFILEAACEAFPQSILQMIAIVYLNETNNYLVLLINHLYLVFLLVKIY